MRKSRVFVLVCTSVRSVPCSCARRVVGMADDESRAVVERGVVIASEEMWALAARRAEVLGRVADAEVVGHEAADRAAEELGSVW